MNYQFGESAARQPLLGSLRRSSEDNDGPIVNQGALHELGMRHQELSGSVDRRVAPLIETKRMEPGVLADELGGLSGQPARQVRESGQIRWMAQILDDVELDAGRFEQGSSRASASVGVQGEHEGRLGLILDCEITAIDAEDRDRGSDDADREQG